LNRKPGRGENRSNEAAHQLNIFPRKSIIPARWVLEFLQDTPWGGDGRAKKGGRRRKVRLIEGNAKCRHLKTITCKGTLRQEYICLSPRTPYTTPYTLYTCILYSIPYLFTQGRGKSWTRKKVRGATVHKAGSTIQTWLTVSPFYNLG
jgi:hypothetical protein